MAHKLISLFTGLLSCSMLMAQVTAQTSMGGTITDKYQNPLAGATVILKGKRLNTMTDSSGKFFFRTVEKGAQVLMISFTGYKRYEQPVMVGDSSVTLTIVLREAGDLQEVVVTAGGFEASDKAKGASLTPMDAVTTAGNNGDLANAMRALPGTQVVGEREGLFVRGGAGEEAKQFMDGGLIRNPNLAPVPGIAQPARISPFLFKGILFSSGGYSALYGQAMSSALILESVDLPDKSSAGFSIFPMSLGAGFQHLHKKKQSSYGMNVRYGHLSFYNRIIPQEPDYFHGPEYLMADANYRVKTGKSGMLKFYVNTAYSEVGMRNPDVDSLLLKSAYHIKGKNLLANVSYRTGLPHNWKLDLVATYSYNRDQVQSSLLDQDNQPLHLELPAYRLKNATTTTPSHFAQGKMVLHHSLANGQAIRFGAEHFYSNDRWQFLDTLSALKDHLTAAFAETDLRLARNVAAKLGGRWEYSSLLRQSTISPRLSVAWRVGKGAQFNLAYGRFYQKPDNPWLFREPGLQMARADHYILNFTKKEGNRMLRLEAYYKRYSHLVKTTPSYSNNGTGYAKGIEFFWRDKKSVKNLDYWITYTWLDTKRDYLNYPSSLQPTFATPHTAAVVAKRFFQDINLSVNMAYYFATGRPFYDLRLDASGKPRIYEQGTTRTYSSLNLSFAYLITFFKKWKYRDFSGIGFGVNNLLGTRQVFGYNFSYNGRNKVPITLPATRMVYIGVFVSLGVDRRDDFINENL